MSKSNKKKVKKEVRQKIGRGDTPDATMVAVREVNAENVVDISEYKQKSSSLKNANLDSLPQETPSVVEFKRKMPAGLRGAAMYVSHKLRRAGEPRDADILEYRYGISEHSGYRPHTTKDTATEFSVEAKKVMLLDKEVSKLYTPPGVNSSTSDDFALVLAHLHQLQANEPDLVSVIYKNAIDDTVKELESEGRNREAQAIRYRHPELSEATQTAASIHETASKFSFSVKEMLSLEKKIGRKMLEAMLIDDENNKEHKEERAGR